MNKHNFLITVTMFLAINAGAQKTKTINKFTDPVLQQIYTSAYNRKTDSVLSYFKSSNSIHRKEAALMFSSMQDSTAIPALVDLLNDANDDVKINAAFAIGQTRSAVAVPRLIDALRRETSVKVKRVELEALGQCANDAAIDFLCQYHPSTNIDTEGLAWAFYRATRKKLSNQKSGDIMVSFLDAQNSTETRHAAAYYFSQASATGYERQVVDVVLHDPSADVRMGILRALRNIKTDEARDALISVADTAKDYRLRVDALSVLKQYNTAAVKDFVWKKLQQDKHISVRITAAEYFTTNKIPGAYNTLMDFAKQEKNWRVRSILLEAVQNIAEDRTEVRSILESLYKGSGLKYEKIQLASVLGSDTANYSFFTSTILKENDREIIQALYSPVRRMRSSNNLPTDQSREYANLLTTFVQSGNKYLVSQGARAISNAPNSARQFISDTSFLVSARSKWKNDSYKAVIADIDNALISSRPGYTRTDPAERGSGNNSQGQSYTTFNWNDIVKIPADQKVRIETARGSFIIRLFVEEAPFSVAHFIDLVKAGAIKDLVFYRVVPNFVNQTGGTPGPLYDSAANVKIRSEYNFRPHHERAVNMASSGRDTETSHWSIMLRPTPWNDYGYTVFGEIAQGMDVVNTIELGDPIIKATLL